MSDDQDIVEWLQAACHDSEGEPLEQDGFSNATVEEVELAIMEIARLRAALKDVSKYIWRGDFHQLDQSTRDTLDYLGCNEGKQS